MPIGEPSLAERVASLAWYHQMRLPGGIVTPGVCDTTRALRRIQLPISLSGRSVLDVGAWDGFYSFEAARRGAHRVLATDSFAWNGSSWGSQEGFLLAREAFGLERVVEARLVDVMDISRETVGGTFDVVLLLGVLYHLRDPITALERCAGVCDGLLVIETETALNRHQFAAGRLYVGKDLNEDGSNWWALNVPAVTGLLREFGFGLIDVKHRTRFYRRLGRAAVGAAQQRQTFRSLIRSQRLVVHSRRTGAPR